MTVSNATRAEHAAIALHAYVEAKGEAFENSGSEIADLVADLLHLAAITGQGEEAVESTLRLARMHFEAEHDDPEEQGESKADAWRRYQQYIEAGDPAITPEDWLAACLSWEEWKQQEGIED